MFSSLTLCSQTEEKRGRSHTDQLKHLQEAPLDATWRLPFRRSTEPLTAQCMDMALLSNILAAYSFVSGSCPISAGPGLSLGLGPESIQERNAVQL